MTDHTPESRHLITANEGAAINLNAAGARAQYTVHAENSDAAPPATGADAQSSGARPEIGATADTDHTLEHDSN